MKHLLFFLLLLFIAPTLIAQTIPNPSSINVGSLSDAQIQRIIDEIKNFLIDKATDIFGE